MTEITRVPLQPIARGAISKLWLGVAAIALAAGGLAWAAMPSGVGVEVVTAGMGVTPADGDVVFARYVGKLADGTEFDRSRNPQIPIQGLFPDGTPLQVGGMIPGMNEALKQMQKGGKYTVVIPADKAYGATPPPGAPIPPNADLTFEVEVVDIMPRADFEQRAQVLQQMMQQAQQQGGGGMPAGRPGEVVVPRGETPPQAPPPAGR